MKLEYNLNKKYLLIAVRYLYYFETWNGQYVGTRNKIPQQKSDHLRRNSSSQCPQFGEPEECRLFGYPGPAVRLPRVWPSKAGSSVYLCRQFRHLGFGHPVPAVRLHRVRPSSAGSSATQGSAIQCRQFGYTGFGHPVPAVRLPRVRPSSAGSSATQGSAIQCRQFGYPGFG